LEKIVKELPVTLDSEDYGSDGDTHYLTRKYLAGRHDLPENLARLLDTKLPASDYFTLAQTPIHQELVRNGVLTGDNIDLDGPREGTLILSPVIREERLIALMDTIDELPGDYDSELVATTIAAHPNAPEEMLHNAMGAAMHSELPIMLIEGNNPKALPLLQRLVEENSLRPEDIAIYKPATPELLQWAAERLMATNTNASGLSDLASHPSFPWKALPLEKMVDYVTEKQSLSIHVSAALAGAMTPADAKRVVEGDDRAAIVFDPRTSGHRLEQLARKSPGLAALVALHPNATTSIDEYVPKGARPLVEKLRGSPEVERLPGRSIGSHEREITPLHI
jgi:hypothetical protein